MFHFCLKTPMSKHDEQKQNEGAHDQMLINSFTVVTIHLSYEEEKVCFPFLEAIVLE